MVYAAGFHRDYHGAADESYYFRRRLADSGRHRHYFQNDIGNAFRY